MAGTPKRNAVFKVLDEAGMQEKIFENYLKYRNVKVMLNLMRDEIGKVSEGMFYMWLHKSDERWKQWQDNRKVLSHLLAEEALSISDKTLDDDGGVQAARLAVEQRRWLAERYNRQDYGKDTQAQLNVVNIGSDFSDALKAVEGESSDSSNEIIVNEEENEDGEQ